MQTDAHNIGREERRALLEQRRAAVARQLRRLAIELTDLDRQLDEIEQSERWLKCDLGFCTLAGTLLSDSAAATEKDGRPTVGKPRQLKLLGDQLVAVDENQTARVERHRPSPRGANYMVLTDIHCVPRQIAEILDHSPPDLAVRPRIYMHPHIHRHAAIAGIASRPARVFHPSFHPSSP
jgi:hypothetical protein